MNRPEDPQIHVLSRKNAMQEGRYAAAISYFREARTRMAPTNPYSSFAAIILTGCWL